MSGRAGLRAVNQLDAVHVHCSCEAMTAEVDAEEGGGDDKFTIVCQVLRGNAMWR